MGEITAQEVRLINKAGKQVGIMSLEQALETSEEDGLDLVEIVPTAEPPVCRIMDYGKFVFAQSKKKKRIKKETKTDTGLKRLRSAPVPRKVIIRSNCVI